MREAKDLIRREQLFVHLCICAFVRPMRQQNHRKKTNTQKTPSDGNCLTMLICVFVLFVYSPTKSQQQKIKYTEDTIRWELFHSDLL